MIELLLEAESALALGLLDRAEILYRQVSGADPRNSIAVVGLARVMLERGDEQGALKHARRALAIDAENTAAQRMVQRLEEVLEFRRNEALSAAVATVDSTSAGTAPAAEVPEAMAPAAPSPAVVAPSVVAPSVVVPAGEVPTAEVPVAVAPVPTAGPAVSTPTAPPPPAEPSAKDGPQADPIPLPGVPPPLLVRPSRSFFDRLLRRR